jgi:AcrR family transcriptional regulator
LPRSSEPARRQLISAAEQVLAAQGVEAALSEITAAAGQRNKSAIQYHFGSRDGLVRAVIDKHLPGIEEVRNRMLDEIEFGSEPPELVDVVQCLVLPLAAKLDDPDGGPEYLMIRAELAARPALSGADTGGQRGLQRVADHIAPDRAEPDPEFSHRAMIITSLLVHCLADRARSHPQRGAVDQVPYVVALIDVISRGLRPPTDATSGLEDRVRGHLAAAV